MSGRRIGLLGGSFDPPHLAHRALGEAALRDLALDELRWLPAGAPWQKAGRSMADSGHRLAMLKLLLQDLPGQVIDARETRRAGPTYTLDTVRELQAEGLANGLGDAEWFLVIGQDQYARFNTWFGWPELLSRLGLAVAARQGQAVQGPPELAKLPHRLERLNMPRHEISASAIRALCAAVGPDRQDLTARLTPLVGAAVAGYIEQQHLYIKDAL